MERALHLAQPDASGRAIRVARFREPTGGKTDDIDQFGRCGAAVGDADLAGRNDRCRNRQAIGARRPWSLCVLRRPAWPAAFVAGLATACARCLSCVCNCSTASMARAVSARSATCPVLMPWRSVARVAVRAGTGFAQRAEVGLGEQLYDDMEGSRGYG
jgi:hypothetical protein